MVRYQPIPCQVDKNDVWTVSFSWYVLWWLAISLTEFWFKLYSFQNYCRYCKDRIVNLEVGYAFQITMIKAHLKTATYIHPKNWPWENHHQNARHENLECKEKLIIFHFLCIWIWNVYFCDDIFTELTFM